MSFKNRLLVLVFLLVGLSSMDAQVQSDPNVINVDQDSLSVEDTIIGKSTFLTLFEGKPGRAALYSLVIPGGGQLYNKKYWKFPLAVAIDGGLVYWLSFNRSQYKFYQRELEAGLAMPDVPSNINDIRARRNGFRKRQEYAWLIMFVGHLVPVFDAYVDRHLKGFDVSPDLSTIQLSGSQDLGYVGLKIGIPIR